MTRLIAHRDLLSMGLLLLLRDDLSQSCLLGWLKSSKAFRSESLKADTSQKILLRLGGHSLQRSLLWRLRHRRIRRRRDLTTIGVRTVLLLLLCRPAVNPSRLHTLLLVLLLLLLVLLLLLLLLLAVQGLLLSSIRGRRIIALVQIVLVGNLLGQQCRCRRHVVHPLRRHAIRRTSVAGSKGPRRCVACSSTERLLRLIHGPRHALLLLSIAVVHVGLIHATVRRLRLLLLSRRWAIILSWRAVAVVGEPTIRDMVRFALKRMQRSARPRSQTPIALQNSRLPVREARP